MIKQLFKAKDLKVGGVYDTTTARAHICFLFDKPCPPNDDRYEKVPITLDPEEYFVLLDICLSYKKHQVLKVLTQKGNVGWTSDMPSNQTFFVPDNSSHEYRCCLETAPYGYPIYGYNTNLKSALIKTPSSIARSISCTRLPFYTKIKIVGNRFYAKELGRIFYMIETVWGERFYVQREFLVPRP